MKAQSALMPLKAEVVTHPHYDTNRFPKSPYKKPMVIKVNGHLNKGHDKDWYLARAAKNAKDFGVPSIEINWS